jgi:hypothetical protein
LALQQFHNLAMARRIAHASGVAQIVGQGWFGAAGRIPPSWSGRTLRPSIGVEQMSVARVQVSAVVEEQVAFHIPRRRNGAVP